jgi:hypothetical protein
MANGIVVESSALGANCIALYKISKLDSLELPLPSLHVYLAGLVERLGNPAYQEKYSQYVVGTEKKLKEIVAKHESDPQPNSIPYLVARYSADFNTDWNAQLVVARDKEFPALCYSYAQFYSAKLGHRTESGLFGLMALSFGTCLELLGAYYQHMRGGPELEIDDQDFLEFKENYPEIANRVLRIVTPPKVRQKKEGKWLV